MSGSATLTGSRVTIFLTCARYPLPCTTGSTGAAVNLSGNSQVSLNGAADTSGITVFGDRGNTAATSITGSASAAINGAFYTPAAAMTVSGNTVLTVAGTLVANQINVAGSSKITDTAPAHLLPNASYTYDAAHRLTQAVVGGTNSAYTYDGGGLRASTTSGGASQHYAWALGAGLPLMLTDGTTSYLYDDTGTPLEQIDPAGNATCYQHDQYGSTRLLTNQAGAVVASYAYDAYGAVTGHTGTPLRWNGQQQDPATGLYYLRNRYYDPATAGFLTRDPLAPVTLSPYQFASGDPLNLVDPGGLAAVPDCPLSIKEQAHQFLTVLSASAATVAVIADTIVAACALSAIVDGPLGVLCSLGAGVIGVYAGEVSALADIADMILMDNYSFERISRDAATLATAGSINRLDHTIATESAHWVLDAFGAAWNWTIDFASSVEGWLDVT